MAQSHTAKNPASLEVQRNTLRGALVTAPKWYYHVDTIGRKKLEEFILEYVKWHNTVREEALRESDHVGSE